MTGTAYLYLINHRDFTTDLTRDVFGELVGKVDSVFFELVQLPGSDTDINDAEKNYNDSIKDQSLSRFEHINNAHAQVMQFAYDKVDRIFIERIKPEVAIFGELRKFTGADLYFDLTFEESAEIYLGSSENFWRYQKEREDKVGEQISAVKGDVLVPFGATHFRLAEVIGINKNVEVNYPYSHYSNHPSILFHRKMINGEPTTLDDFARLFVQDLLSETLKDYKSLQYHQADGISVGYANIMPLDQIERMREKYKEEKEKINEHNEKTGLNYGRRAKGVRMLRVDRKAFWEKFVKEEGLPSVKEMKDKVDKVESRPLEERMKPFLEIKTNRPDLRVV